jgi:hypothetical protein
MWPISTAKPGARHGLLRGSAAALTRRGPRRRCRQRQFYRGILRGDHGSRGDQGGRGDQGLGSGDYYNEDDGRDQAISDGRSGHP